MRAFSYRDGRMVAESVPIPVIAAAVGTPFYCYSQAAVAEAYGGFAAAFRDMDATICFAVKANGNLAVLRVLAGEGAGADVVSEGELARALNAGIPADKIVFSGVGKTERELAAALQAGVLQINVESEAELAALSRIAGERGVQAPVAIRVNPDVDARTHRKITTGTRSDKFGIPLDGTPGMAADACAMGGIDFVGIAVHIGSQITELAPFASAYGRVRDLVLSLAADGIAVQRLDLGGGLGIAYADADETARPPTPAEYAECVRTAVGDLNCRLIFEPGRAVVGDAGVLVGRVIYVKESGGRSFVVIDAAMNDLMRPALYDARHGIEPVTQPAPGDETAIVDVVGPVCETTDTFAVRYPLPSVRPGDLLAVTGAGAYGAVMASSYNARPIVPEVLVKDDGYAVVRARIGDDVLMTHESYPDWLADSHQAGKAAVGGSR
ncbi:MAG: diaminopimelate decarboxylase [Rhodospirillales bacterium]|jgi:diaminopimelate decarboxylase|nr:diaminopimelate decarboxylase [Rhodospirillales bacterium]